MAATAQDRFRDLKPAKPEIADHGKVRLGDGVISGDFPVRR